jgi:hypothetical protein
MRRVPKEKKVRLKVDQSKGSEPQPNGKLSAKSVLTSNNRRDMPGPIFLACDFPSLPFRQYNP